MARQPRARPDGLDRRVFVRSRSDEQASLEFGESGSLACVVRDRSAGGARVVFAAAPPLLPQEFSLRSGAGEPVRARLIWMDGRQAGVAFTAAS